MASTTLQLSFLVSFAVLLILSPKFGGAASVGVYYKRQGSNQTPAQSVVSKIQEMEFSCFSMSEPDAKILQLLRHTGMPVSIGVRNQDILLMASSFAAAQRWIRTNIVPYASSIRFKYIVVGDGAIGTGDAPHVLIAIMNLHKALASTGLDKTIKVTTSVSAASVLNIPPSNRPSMATFTEDSRVHLTAIAWFLARNDAPLLADVFPYYHYIELNDHKKSSVSLSHALMNARSGTMIDDGTMKYDNLFDVILDSVYAALEKVGAARNMSVVVSKTGWPSAGRNSAASVDTARTYAENLIEHLNSGRGTPRRPGKEIEVHLYTLYTDGAQTSNGEEFGLFYPNNKPVYNFPNL